MLPPLPPPLPPPLTPRTEYACDQDNPTILRMMLLWPAPPQRNDKFYDPQSSLCHRSREACAAASEQLSREPGGLQRFRAGVERINAIFERAIEIRIKEMMLKQMPIPKHPLLDPVVHRVQAPPLPPPLPPKLPPPLPPRLPR